MNLTRLYEILNETTLQLRKGDVVVGEEKPTLNVTEIHAMPHVSQATSDIVPVDMEFLVIGVDKGKAEARKTELVALLNHYPQPDRLSQGPSYIEVGADIGDQGAAFQLFALGKVLGLWDVITPGVLGMTGAQAREAAGNGFIMMSGYRAMA